ncbi:aldehyde ferredoxin oxidoreductase family protein [Christensenella sp. MSJ-20]|uniref:aldehyde ferredoxin oxidoreductase family protein n=1 Tax=Christensenella sp. MSJ-20 TaxID=2841518 RepID=UPI001C75A13E|nr:aldehyde ferredoxin oxidoreductase family protein [Christensenella sp. MSJ-20]
MPYGYNGKILKVNLTTREITVDEHDEKWYRQYLGGTGIGVYYAMTEIPAGADPLGPDNVLTLSASVLTGAPLPAISRVSCNMKSPLTGGIGDAQGGGYWAPELKYAGFDAVVLKGRSETPVYLWIHDGQCEIRDASHLWGKDTGESEAMVREELGDNLIRVAGIGPAGENMVRYACVINERKHSAGRTGAGAVMGSKNVKLIACRGKNTELAYEYADPQALKDFMKRMPEIVKSPGVTGMAYGTHPVIIGSQEMGQLPTHNFSEGVYDHYMDISHVRFMEVMEVTNETCYMCPVRCKRAVKGTSPDGKITLDPRFGGPEYESASTLGSYVMVDDPFVMAKANELCNRYSCDTISVGAVIAFAMDCYEHGILKPEMCDGLELRFGNNDVLIPLIEKICHREGYLGNLLAEGSKKAAEILGNGAEKFSIEVKGNPLPAHMPQVKKILALHYAVNGYGADHCSCTGDGTLDEATYESKAGRDGNFGQTIYNSCESWDTLDWVKTQAAVQGNRGSTLTDMLGCCGMAWGITGTFDFFDMQYCVNAVTGWKMTQYEMMRSGQRVVNLMRVFNQREGFTKADDWLPERMFEPFQAEGPSKGKCVSREDLRKCIDLYYDMQGWDENGFVRDGTLYDLDIKWARP